jgi:hypothetical protein
MSTDINPDVSPARRPTGVQTQLDGNLANNPYGAKQVRMSDGPTYGPMDDDDDCCE